MHFKILNDVTKLSITNRIFAHHLKTKPFSRLNGQVGAITVTVKVKHTHNESGDDMVNSYELSGLDPYAFENLVNLLALKVLGVGASSFGFGSDGGRDGFFEGEAPYPSNTEHWKGTWYIQSKFHFPHLSKDPQKWLIEKVKAELSAFEDESSGRIWPDNWIIATNIDPSGKPETGSFDAIRALVTAATKKKVNVAIWGGNKILGLLSQHSDIAQQYAHFITPGQVLASLQVQLTDQYASVSTIIRYLVATQFSEQIFTKLDQAGSSSDTRPGVHHLFIDLPFNVDGSKIEGTALDYLCRASAQPQRHSVVSKYTKEWQDWSKNPHHARVALLKGGPGQGKSTVGQYFSQIQRAALLLLPGAPKINDKLMNSVNEVKLAANKIDAWPSAPRIPVFIELKEYAHWYGQKSSNEPRGVLTYLANRIHNKVEQEVLAPTLRRALSVQSWFVLFDGLDEVPNDVKDKIADEVNNFVNEVIINEDADVLTLCTSRPQGYSGQFSALDGPILNLQKLNVQTAILCAEPVVRYDRSDEEGTRSLDLLKAAAASQSVQQLMTTPLQSHIMAVVVRDGGRPPERQWQLFENFYQVMKKRESLKNVHNPRISRLLREEDRLLRAVHNRLGFVLHARAERSDGAQTTLTKDEFRILVTQVVEKLSEDDSHNTVNVVMEAMTERLVLVSTPENGAHVRFDIRQLQEFFAAEFLYDAVSPTILAHRVEIIGGDSHWLEVMHFLLSALVENRRTTELDVVIKELERLNEGNLDGIHRLFYRRMAKGTYLATRLLIEGVLEQDKRDRLKFKPLFEPIGGIFNVDMLLDLANIRPLNSKIWLINLLIEKITEANNSESLGACIALGWLLPEKHSFNTELIQYFYSYPSAYQQEAVSAWSNHRLIKYEPRTYESLSFWAVCAMAKIANCEQWLKFTEKSKKEILLLLIAHQNHLIKVFGFLSMDPKLATLISIVFNIEIENGNDLKVYQLGPLQAKIYDVNWTNRSLPPALTNALLECNEIQTSGLFQIILELLRFSQKPDFNSLQNILAMISIEQGNILGTVPRWLVAFIPCRSENYFLPFDCSHLHTMDSQEFDKLIYEKNLEKFPTFTDDLTIRSNKSDSPNILKLFEHMPLLGVHIFGNEMGNHFRIEKTDLEEGKILAKEALLKSPSLAKMHFLIWGKLAENDSEYLVKLKELVKSTDFNCDDVVYGGSNISPLPINTEDSNLLCIFAKGLFVSFAYLDHKEWSDILKELSNIILQCNLTTTKLVDISANATQDANIRVAAQLLNLLCSDNSSIKHKLSSALQNLTQTLGFINEETANWYIESLCELMQHELDENIPFAVTGAEALMVVARDKVGIRSPLAKMLSFWREKSSSPLHTAQSLQRWLDE